MTQQEEKANATKKQAESISDFVRAQWDGQPASSYISLGELVHLRCNGQEVNVADLAARLRQGKQQEMPVLKIIKKRAAYQRYLENREKKKEAAAFSLDIDLPEIELPELPER